MREQRRSFRPGGVHCVGIPYGRDYEEILDEFSDALINNDHLYEAFDMSLEEWQALEEQDQAACARTLADDLIYGLGGCDSLRVAGSRVSHDPKRHVIRIDEGDALTRIIHLV